MEPLVQWDALDFRVSGARIQSLAQAALASQQAPLQDLKLEFRNGELYVSGLVVKFLPIPFHFFVRRVEIASATTIRVVLEDFAAFGFIPLPKLLLQLFEDRKLNDGVIVHPEALAVTILLDRFLPPFVDLKIDAIDFVAGGVRVRLGEGGADPPLDDRSGPWKK